MKRLDKPKINDDVRWEMVKQLRGKGDTIKANKLRETILDSYKWKKPCHHVAER